MDTCDKLYELCDCDAVIVLAESNTYYLSGYESSNCQIVIISDKSYFFTDKRYYLEALNKLSNRFTVIAGGFEEIVKLLKTSKKIGWDNNVNYATYKTILNYFSDKSLVEISDRINDLRDIKQQFEIDNILKAQSITELAFLEAVKSIKKGVTEIEIAALIEYVFLKNGASLAFDSIVAFGKNGASPHAHRTFNEINDGEFITMDIGARWNGYCSDMTRTVAFGQPSTKQLDVYDTVLEAQKKAINEIKPFMTGKNADNIAREYIKNRGYGEYFTHSLGHGVGIDIHEGTSLSPSCDKIIKPNMIVTVEPGIYIDNEFGVRIEDMVQVTDNMVKSLTKSNKKLIII